MKKEFPNSPFLKSLEFIFDHNKLPWGRYLLTIQLLAYYAESDVSVDQTKPDMVEVLAVNFENLKKKFLNYPN